MSTPSIEYIISITSRDRIGIVYEISSALAELSGNIADSRQSVMCGYYTMILRASFPAAVNRQTIEAKLAEVDQKSPTPLNILVNSVKEPLPSEGSPENRYVLTASGTDQIGFVARVAGFCVKHQINILDLSTTLSDGEFVMMLEVDLSRCGSISEVRTALAEFGRENKLRVVLQHHDIFKAVNEISLPFAPKGSNNYAFRRHSQNG
ncbi:hypothetical protein EG834_00005 [bacterium]|nr:hypothetical protein [bacterium]